MTNQFDLSVVIGRFQPFHLGHSALLAKALEIASRVVIVCGSAKRSRSAKNPFTWKERSEMISSTVSASERKRLHIYPVEDYYNDQLWGEAVNKIIHDAPGKKDRIAIVGHSKDISSYYLDLFPQLTYVPVELQGGPVISNCTGKNSNVFAPFSASQIRKLLFEGGEKADLSKLVKQQVQRYLEEWVETPFFEGMREEHLVIEESRRVYGSGPFITLDTLLFAKDHLLLVQRGRYPGKGLWAIPGGFLDINERLLDGAKRELLEETGLDLNNLNNKAKIKGKEVFDHPDRSQRGRIITHVFCFELFIEALPCVQGMDDAATAKWVPIKKIQKMEELFFEDHYHIIGKFLG